MNNDKYKILVISNICFSEEKNRTLCDLVKFINSNQVANFYLHGNPDKKICSNYFCVSDKDALNSFFHKKKETSLTLCNNKESNKFKIKKNCRNLLFRDLIWSSFKWWSKNFDKFLDDFLPNIILLQAGDSPFMYTIALKIAKKYNASLVMYNTEDYVLKKKLYYYALKYSIFHKLLQRRLKRVYKKFMQKVSFCIYNIMELEEEYQKKYPHPGKSITLYTASKISKLNETIDTSSFHLLYCGKLGVGRIKPLDEIAKILYEIDKNAILDVYGNFNNENDKSMLLSNSNVHYGGFVSYNEILTLMSKSSMLIHCENSEMIDDLRHSFSTKIADSLSSGIPFLVYASEEYYFVKYLIKNNCAHIANNKEQLKTILFNCIYDEQYRKKYVNSAIKVAHLNHNDKKYWQQMENVFEKILNNK